jgi:hypothetical protein
MMSWTLPPLLMYFHWRTPVLACLHLGKVCPAVLNRTAHFVVKLFAKVLQDIPGLRGVRARSPGCDRMWGRMMGRDIGPLLVAVGLLVVFVGVLAWNGWLSWFGHLPGDVRINREDVRVYFPWVSMIVVSVVLSILISLLRR